MKDHIYNELKEIPIPASLHSRCVIGMEEAKQEQKGQITMLKFHKKTIAAAATLVLAIGLFAGSSTALAKDFRGFFSDVFRFDGAVVGTEYHNATEEVTFNQLPIRGEKLSEIGVQVAFVYPEEAPYAYIEELSMQDVTITDAAGSEVWSLDETEPVPIRDGAAHFILSADLSSGKTYTLHCPMLQGHAKAEQPLPMSGTWELTFTAP